MKIAEVKKMSDSEGASFFRPWSLAQAAVEAAEAAEAAEEVMRVEKGQRVEEEPCACCASSDTDSDSERSSSVISVERSSSVNSLERSSSVNSDVAYHQQAYQENLDAASLHLSPSVNYRQDYRTSVPPQYGWMSPNMLDMQLAVNRLQAAEAAAKQIKKLRPKKFKCRYCPGAFSNNGQRGGHERIHTGERPFKCDFDKCGKTFTRNEELTRHKRIHTGERPHACPICRKSFGRKDHLKKHMKTHDNRQVIPLAAATASQFMGLANGNYSLFAPPTMFCVPTLRYL